MRRSYTPLSAGWKCLECSTTHPWATAPFYRAVYRTYDSGYVAARNVGPYCRECAITIEEKEASTP